MGLVEPVLLVQGERQLAFAASASGSLVALVLHESLVFVEQGQMRAKVALPTDLGSVRRMQVVEGRSPRIFVSAETFWWADFDGFRPAEEIILLGASEDVTVFPSEKNVCAVVDPQLGLYLSGASENLTRLHAGVPISAVAWLGSLLVWASDAGVYLLDVATQQKVAHLQALKSIKKIFFPSENMCCLATDNELSLVSLAYSAEEGVKVTRVEGEITTVVFPGDRTEIFWVSLFQPPFEEDLAILSGASDGGLWHHVVSLDSLPETLSEKVWEMDRSPRGVDGGVWWDGEKVWGLRRRGLGEHAAELVLAGRAKDALVVARASGNPGVMRATGFGVLRPLVSSGNLSLASEVIDELSLTGASEWRGVIRLFEGSLEWVVDRIPTDLEDERVYAEALEQLTESPEVVLRVLLKWPSVDWGRARELFVDKDGERWFRVRVLVLERAGAVEEALNLALGERDLEEVLRLVGVHAGQREWILEHIVSVLSLDARRVSAWLVDRLQAFPMQEVVVRATRAPFLLLVYLEEAFQRQATLVVPWKREMARLATQFGNPQIVEKLVRQLVWETSELEELLGLDKTSDALVLWKLDRPYEALELLVGERDFSRATQFAEELGDPVLWDCVLQRLIETGDDSCLDAFLSGLSGELLVKTSAKIWACKRFRLTDTVKQSLAKIDRDARMKGLVLRITLNEQRQRGRAKSGCVRRATTLGDCCFCGRAMVAKGPEWQLESLSIKEEHPNSNCQNPAVAVFEDGRIAHASCLIDRKIR